MLKFVGATVTKNCGNDYSKFQIDYSNSPFTVQAIFTGSLRMQ